MADLLLATGNQNKVKELKEILAGSGWRIFSLRDFPHIEIPPENGETFQQNALIKALAAAEQSGLLTMADDSGLVVEALNGAPGVHSARFAGKAGDDAANNAKLLSLMKYTPKENRQAYFCCVIALAYPDGSFFTAHGQCHGEIAESPSGEGGFGYDPLFYLPKLKKTMAQLSGKEKNALSHRGRAMRRIARVLTDIQKNI